MDWNRAKNILIGLLCALNLFLLGNYLYTRYTLDAASQTQAELETYLAGRNVALLCQLPRMQTPPREIGIAENTEKLSDAALSALLGADMRRENGEAVSQTGRFSWVAGVLDGTVCTLPDGTEADLDAVLQLLDSAGITADRIERDAQSAVLYKDHGEAAQPIFNAWIRIDRLEDGAWSVSGRWHLGQPAHIGADGERDIAGLLVTFTNALLTQGTELTEITAIEPGWITSVLTNVGVKLTPVFAITTDAGRYYIGATDAQLYNIG